MALTYVLIQQLVPETTPGIFFVCLVGLGFLKNSLIWFCILQLKSEAQQLPECSMFGGWYVK